MLASLRKGRRSSDQSDVIVPISQKWETCVDPNAVAGYIRAARSFQKKTHRRKTSEPEGSLNRKVRIVGPVARPGPQTG